MEKNMELDLLALFNECAKEAKKGEPEDNVNHPKHYNIGDIEVIEYITGNRLYSVPFTSTIKLFV